MNQTDNNKITFLGASSIIFKMTIVFTIPIIVINILFKSIFDMHFIPNIILISLGIFLLCIGIPLYIITFKELKNAYENKKLLTKGIFSVCRNPLFAEVILLILPGIILFFNSWLLLTIPCFMYIMIKIYIKNEEDLLEEIFGEEYIKYKSNTPAILPQIWKYNR